MTNQYVSIAPLLKILTGGGNISKESVAADIASALALLFDNHLSPLQCASLLTCLRLTGLEEDPQVIAACAQTMRSAAATFDEARLRQVVSARAKSEGRYYGGLCDIVGTGGDGHSTFNVSTTSSIVASALLVIAKHGAQASSSKSGSADVLMAIKPTGPDIEAVTSQNVRKLYEAGNYAFLFAKQFHPGMRYAAPIRKDIGFRTIFNILGPLANPLYLMMEAGIYGVYKKSLGSVYADALRLCGAKKAMVVCGDEDLDEVSCAGVTHCWNIVTENVDDSIGEMGLWSNDGHKIVSQHQHMATKVYKFELKPADFGLPVHSLEDVLPGRGASENAEILMQLLRNELPLDHPTLHFVLMNTAALLVVSGICDADTSKMGPEDDGKVVKEVGPGGGRWKEGVRRARWAIESGLALRSLQTFTNATQGLEH